MGEDPIDPTAAPEELTAAALPGGAASAGPALPTVAGAASSEQVGILAQEQHGAEIDAALTKTSADTRHVATCRDAAAPTVRLV